MRALPVFSLSRLRVSSPASRDLSTPKCCRIRAKSRAARIEQLHQVVLDLDVVVGARQAQAGGALQRLRVVLFSLPDQRIACYMIAIVTPVSNSQNRIAGVPSNIAADLTQVRQPEAADHLRRFNSQAGTSSRFRIN